MNIKQSEKPPIFIVGSQRSGTTMLRLMLNAHPKMAIPFESGFITRLYKNLESFGSLTEIDNVDKLLDAILANKFVQQGGLIVNRQGIIDRHPKTYAELIQVIYEMYAESKGKERWGDKEPAYVTDIDILLKLFPNVRVIHLVRDGRDVATSLLRLSWGSKNLPAIARDWAWKLTLAHKSGSFLGEQYMEVKYEDLVLEPEKNLKNICEFIHEPYDPAMLNYHDSAKTEMPKDSLDFHKNSVRSPDKSKVLQWKTKMSLADQAIFQEEAGDVLSLFGYEQGGTTSKFKTNLRKLHYALIDRW